MSYTPPPVIPLATMARRLRVRPDWLRAEAEAGRVPHIVAGEQMLFSPAAVEAVLLERAQRPPDSDTPIGRPARRREVRQ